MKKHLFFFLSFFSISIVVRAQLDSTKKRQIIHGVVINEKNKPVQDASVIIQGEEKGTVTDSLGYFKINAKSDAVLIINAAGYESLLEKIRNEELIRAVMKRNPLNNSAGADETIKQQSFSNAFQDFSKTETGNLYRGSSLPVFIIKENTVGSRYLFDSWVKGKLIDTTGKEINTNDYVFNYDKMTGKLIATQDKKIVIEINDAVIKSYSLTDLSGKETKFEKSGLINNDKFLVSLAGEKNNKYSLYKLINTKFVKANFVTNGLIESGKKYDEYADTFEYYIVYNSSGIHKKVELKEKLIKKTITEDGEKVKTFFIKHTGDKLNESLLAELILFLNQ